MPSPDRIVTLALDFDGSLVEAHSTPLRWRPRAKDFVIGAAAAGIKLWIHSCRCAVACIMDRELPGDPEEFWRSGRVPPDVEASWAMAEEMRGFLELEGVIGLVEFWTLPGKPIADMYPDDLGERPDWLALAGELGVALSNAAVQGGNQALVATTGFVATGVVIPSPAAAPAAVDPVPAPAS